MNNIFWVISFVFFCFAAMRLRLALLILPLFFPLYLLKTTVLGIPFTLVEVFVYSCSTVFVIKLFFRKIKNSKKLENRKVQHTDVQQKKEQIKKEYKKRMFSHRYRFFLWLFIVVFFIGSLLSLIPVVFIEKLGEGQVNMENLKMALGIIKGWVIMPLILFFLWCARVPLLKELYSPKDRFFLLNSYTSSAFILSGWALYQVISHTYITPDARASGPFESANYLALYIGPALVYGATRFYQCVFGTARGVFVEPELQSRTFQIIMWFFAMLVIGLALFFSKSYAAMVAVGVALLCYGVIEWRSQKKINQQQSKHPKKFLFWHKLLGFGVILTAVLYLVFALDPAKWQSMFRFGERNSSSVRIEVYTVSFDLLQRNWLLGVGPGQFQKRYEAEASQILSHSPYESTMLHPHNIFLAMWLNFGFLGFVGFMGILIIVFKKTFFELFQNKNVEKKYQIIGIGFLLLLEVVVHGLFDSPFFKNDLALLFWMIIAIVVMEGSPNGGTSCSSFALSIPNPRPPSLGDDSKKN